ncbi:MAG: hypothetical protein AAB316_09785 [Bacteroidota bacterium]
MNDAETYVENYLRSLLPDFQRKGLGQSVTELNVWEKVLIYKYSLDGYESLNKALRRGKPHPMERLLNEALAKLPDFEDVVFRGADLGESKKQFYKQAFENQEVFTEPAFLSASKFMSIANMYSRGNCIFHIDSLHGKSIEELAFFGVGSGQNEREILFRSSSRFLITGLAEIEGLTQFTVKEIDQP